VYLVCIWEAGKRGSSTCACQLSTSTSWKFEYVVRLSYCDLNNRELVCCELATKQLILYYDYCSENQNWFISFTYADVTIGISLVLN